MTKKILLALVLSVLTAGMVFSQTSFKDMAKNTITLDFGPTIVGGVFGAAGKLINGGEGASSSGFGIGTQYERQLLKKLSVAGRFAYLGGGVGIPYSYDIGYRSVDANLGIKLSSFSIEGHVRYYPWGKTFFMDGMLGYAGMILRISGTMTGKDMYGHDQPVSVNMDASKGFFKMGAKIGWRISFGKKGGFTIEPSFGYSYGISFGDTFGAQLAKQIKANNPGIDVDDEIGDFDNIFKKIQNFIFIGGPRLSLSLGWSF